MKKILFKIILFIGIGFSLGEIIFGKKIETIKQLANKETYYFLQEGIYNNKKLLKENCKYLNDKIIEKRNDKYYVFIAITKDPSILNKLKDIYEKAGIKTIIIQKNISSNSFSENLDQLDYLIKNTKDNEQILLIEKVILANYEEMIKKE